MKSLAWTLLAAACAVPLAAHAQVYKWIDEHGKVRYGDTPPPSAKVKVIAAPAAPSAAADSAPASDAGKGSKAKKGPLTPAEQEQQFRRRVKEAQEAAAKADKERQDKEANKENCASAQEALRTLESGQRVSRTNAQGERYFLDDDQRAQETARAQQAVNQWCR